MNTRPIIIDCPWPPKELSPNAKVHWGAKARKAKSYRADCQLAARAAIGPKKPDWTYVRAHLTFCPPDARSYDDDNLESRFKAGRDGISDALGIDDGNWIVTRETGPLCRPHGKVTVELREG